MQKMYLTTPIYYVNDVPHIGHAYCTLATDTLVRYWRTKLGKENVFFLTGTDENSQKTVEAATKAGEPITEYLEKMAAQWRATWDEIGISYDDFIRTTEERHMSVVHDILKKCIEKGDIEKDVYKGKYCTGCEAFKKDSDLDENGNCPDHGKPPQVIEEENYFFRLSRYQDKLLKLFEENKEFLRPPSRYNEIYNFIKSGLEDISISRENAQIGVPHPTDPDHKIYVWFDALINYYSALQETKNADFWNVAHHIIGKDITRFHAVIWPAMLMSAGIEPPKQVFAHGFFTIDGRKMSKSLGNVVSPLDLSRKYGNDALRVGLLSSFEFGNDGDFSLENFDQFYNFKLAGGVGNLFNRVITLVQKFLEGTVPEAPANPELEEQITACQTSLEKKLIKQAIDEYFGIMESANKLLNDTQVWTLAKTEPEKARPIFGTLLQQLNALAKLAEVFLPEIAPKMKTMLGNGKKVGSPEILFPKVD